MIKGFVDKHKGRLCFVLGSGPSLRNLNPDLLKSHITIAVNEAILKVPDADYYFSDDYATTLLKSWLILKNIKCKLIINKTAGGFGSYEPKTGVRVFEGIDKDRIFYFEVERKLKMGKEDDKLKLDSSSSHTAVHFAHVLGCDPIVLLGCDCKYVDGKYHFTDFPNQPDGGRIKPEYDDLVPRPYGGIENVSDGGLGMHYNNWQKIRKNNPDINIINASGGRLSMFPKMSLEEVLRIYNEKT